MTRHVNSIHRQIKIPCKFCNQKFNWHHEVSTHLKNVHPQEIEYKCFICDTKFFNKFIFQQHMSLVHKIEFHKGMLPKAYQEMGYISTD